MAKDIWDKLKILNIDYKVLILIFTAISGLSTGGYQWWDKTEVAQQAKIDVSEKQKVVDTVIAEHEYTKKQVAEVAKYYIETTTPKIVIEQSGCPECDERLDNSVKKLNKKIDKINKTIEDYHN